MITETPSAIQYWQSELATKGEATKQRYREYFEEFYLWDYYEYFTKKLIAATVKIVDKIDIKQLLLAQAEDQKEFWEDAIRLYNKLGITKQNQRQK
jgi:hypothetical protein